MVLLSYSAKIIVQYYILIKVFFFISEQHILREELKTLQTLNVRLTQKTSEVEEELKRTKSELEQLKVNKSDSDVIIQIYLYYLFIMFKKIYYLKKILLVMLGTVLKSIHVL